jgi:hypothetical protein
VLGLGLGACTLGEGGRVAQPTISTTDTTAAPERTTLPAATGTATCPPIPAPATPDPVRPKYVLHVDVRPSEKAASGTEQVHFRPDLQTDRLVFRLWPNSPDLARAGAHLDVGSVTVGGTEVKGTLESPTRLVVPLPGPIPPGEEVEAGLTWSLRIPESVDDRLSITGDAVRLGSFFPILSWEPGFGWATDPATGGFAEDSTAPTADFDVTISTPPGLTVLASGVPDRPGHWTATAMRDVAISVGTFTTAETTATAPNPVKITIGVESSVGDSADTYASKAQAVVEDFGRRFGPYPWPTLSISITPHLGGGIEYPSHIMQGPGTFGDVEAHEIGHQWFYGLVGNDQGRDPWLDEGLATWAESRYQDSLGSLRLVTLPAAAREHLGEPMTYWKDQRDVNQSGVYVQGALALDALGPADLVDCALRVYVAQNAYRIARPADLAAALGAVFPDAKATLERFGAKL